MRIPRVHVDMPLVSGQRISLPENRAHYLRTVLRLQTGAGVLLFNGDGSEYAGRVELPDRRTVVVELGECQEPERESPLRTHLGLALSKGERMDYAIQKCTELGISRITPLMTARSEVRLKGDRAEKRLNHWRQVAISACEQSGRCRLPEVRPAVPLSDWLGSCDEQLRLVMDHRQARPLGDSGEVGSLAILTGPEGGFNEAELSAAHEAGFRGIRLGPRVLRAETAPVATLGIAQWLWGDWGTGGAE